MTDKIKKYIERTITEDKKNKYCHSCHHKHFEYSGIYPALKCKLNKKSVRFYGTCEKFEYWYEEYIQK